MSWYQNLPKPESQAIGSFSLSKYLFYSQIRLQSSKMQSCKSCTHKNSTVEILYIHSSNHLKYFYQFTGFSSRYRNLVLVTNLKHWMNGFNYHKAGEKIAILLFWIGEGSLSKYKYWIQIKVKKNLISRYLSSFL